MPVYNPYASQPSGDYVEFPPGTPPSLIDNYYRAVLASRQQDDRTGWVGGINALSGVGQKFGEAWIEDSFNQGQEQRKFEHLLSELNYRQQLDEEDTQRQRAFLQDDYRAMGAATSAWANANQPGPSTFNTYEEPGYQEPPTDVNLPAEPGGHVQIPGDVIEGRTITEEIPGERPAPIDAWLRFAGQYPESAGLMQAKMGATFGQSVLDPSFQDNRQAEIRRKDAVTNRTVKTTDPEVERLLSTAEGNRARTANTGVRTNDAQFKADLKQKALRLFDIGTPEAVEMGRRLLEAANGKPWESSEERAGGALDARKARGLPYDKPRGTGSTKGPTSSVTERRINRFIELTQKGPNRTGTEEQEFQILTDLIAKMRDASGNPVLKAVGDMLREGNANNYGTEGATNPRARKWLNGKP